MIKGVRRITIFEVSADGGLAQVSEYRKKTSKRKRSRGLKQPERNARKVLSAMRVWVDEMDERHDKSSRKRKDGWLRDAPRNVGKADKKALKKLRKLRVF